MFKRLLTIVAVVVLAAGLVPARADDYDDTIKVFRSAMESSKFFSTAYGYAVFPTIGKGGAGIGGAYGRGRVYEKGKYIGDTSMTQITVGLQLGGQGFSEIIFFEDQRALREFTGGNFEFGAEASAVAVTAGVGGQAGSTGSSMGASGTQRSAAATGVYHKGMAAFTVAKAGLMYQATLGGQKFNYKAR